MRLAKVRLADGAERVAIYEDDTVQLLELHPQGEIQNLADVMCTPQPEELATRLATGPRLKHSEVRFLAPIDRQEVWAAGVTYKRSQVARMEESEHGASHYDRVYTADRPEIFFKATPNRVAGPDEPLRIRKDTKWSVPEPELTLMVSRDLRLVGYTVGNDMSARDIEGENPLYLPQAKMYKQCCGLGPCVLIASQPLSPENVKIGLEILRGGQSVFQGETNVGQIARPLAGLIEWLGKDNEFPHGVFLLTGTGVVPPDNFTLHAGDVMEIEITGIGKLRNPVIQG